jgi:hypothetical protein
MKVLRINKHDGSIKDVLVKDWEDMSRNIDLLIDDDQVEIQAGPNGIVNYIFQEDMFLIIPD